MSLSQPQQTRLYVWNTTPPTKSFRLKSGRNDKKHVTGKKRYAYAKEAEIASAMF